MKSSIPKAFVQYTPVLILLAWFFTSVGPALGQSHELPVAFVGNRIFLQPVTGQGDTLNLLADTGGALVLTKDAANRLKLPAEAVEIRNRIKGKSVARLPAWGLHTNSTLKKSAGRCPFRSGKL